MNKDIYKYPKLSKHLFLSKDIIFHHIIPFEIGKLEDSIINNDISSFIILKKTNKYIIMDSLILAIQYGSVDIVEWIFKYEKKIDKLYNGYPLIYYSWDQEIDKFLKWTNDNFSMYEEYIRHSDNRSKDESFIIIQKLNKEIIENNLIKIALLITNTENIIQSLTINIILNHNHIMFSKINKNSLIMKSMHYESNIFKSFLIDEIIKVKDLYELFEFNTDYNLILYRTLNILKSDKDDLHNIIDVYDLHNLYSKPIVIKITIKEFYIKLLKLLYERYNANLITNVENLYKGIFFVDKDIFQLMFENIPEEYKKNEYLIYKYILYRTRNINDINILFKIVNIYNKKDILNLIKYEINNKGLFSDNFFLKQKILNLLQKNKLDNKIEIETKIENKTDNKKYNKIFVSNNYTVKELQQFCRDNNISGYSKLRKNELIEYINMELNKKI